MQKWIGIGNLTRKPEKVEGTEKTLCRLNMAINDTYTDREGKRAVDFFNVIVWGKQADNCLKYLDKGSKISVIGKIKTRKWETEAGETRYAVEVIAQEIEYLTTKSKENKEEKEVDLQPVDDPDEQLPF